VRYIAWLASPFLFVFFVINEGSVLGLGFSSVFGFQVVWQTSQICLKTCWNFPNREIIFKYLVFLVLIEKNWILHLATMKKIKGKSITVFQQFFLKILANQRRLWNWISQFRFHNLSQPIRKKYIPDWLKAKTKIIFWF
jgi:hypothetical protein